MQIHEVFGTLKAMAKDPGSLISPSKFAQIQQAERSADAEKSAKKLYKQGYGQPVTAPSMNQLISQVQNDSAAQQLVRTWAAQWPKIAAGIPPAPPASAAPAAPTTPAQSLAVGGQTFDPNDPATARIIAQLKAQGKLNEQQSTAPDLAQYRNQFVEWADNVVERTARQPGVIEAMKQDSNWAQRFKQAEDAVVTSVNNAQKNTQAVQAYLTLAVAAARASQQEQPGTANRSQAVGGLNDPRANALATTLGLDAADIAKLNAFVRRNNETINPQGTGSDSLDALLRAAKLLK
jgi:hypothetical protein